jgi:hypothetical protein
MLSVELKHLADVMDAVGGDEDIVRLGRKWSATVSEAIWEHAVRFSVYLELHRTI